MQYPFSFFVATALVCGMILELWRHRHQPWTLPAVVIFATVAVWYFADPILYAEKYRTIPSEILSAAYWEVCLFLIVFRLSAPWFSVQFTRRSRHRLMGVGFGVERIFVPSVVFWAVLLIYGTSRMDWDFVGALFPLDARNGNLLWLRAAAADAGPTGFLVSTCGYLYLMLSACFGVFVIWERRISYKVAAAAMMMISWPFFLLNGTRNGFVAVATPWAFTYLLFGRQPRFVRIVTLVAAFVAVDYSFKVVISHRNVGFRDFWMGTEEVNEQTKTVDETEHAGLNMIEELCFINMFCASPDNTLTLGMDYLGNVLNMVPRVLWANKPLMGIEYAKWRGFGGGDNDIGVFATVSSGLIGQGVLEFGTFFGPIAPAILMAVWCGLLARWWAQRAALLRMILVLLGLGVTFNLGRNISALILWPVIFAYLLTRCIEKFFLARSKRCPSKWIKRPMVAARPPTDNLGPQPHGL